NYDTAMQLAQNVALGLKEIQGGKGFNSSKGTFSTERMNLSWIANLNDIHYNRLAEDRYGDYLNKHPGDKKKIITIVKYEESRPEDGKKVDAFLTELNPKDATEIKY